jgi:L-ascorbate metabolism protein UlaG (beta-lactamase superfamily)
MKMRWQAFSLVVALTAAWNVAEAQNVKVTPIGQRTGEFCAGDRAILFEDPTGARLLYDPGNTVAGAGDPRLGNDVHAILISHAHSEHLGNGKLSQNPDSPTSTCGNTSPTPAPSSNTAEIAAAKNSVIVAGGPLATVLGRLIAAVTGSNTAGCPTGGLTNETIVPRTTPCTAGLLFGAKRTIRVASASRGVEIAMVTAVHPNDLTNMFVADPGANNMLSPGLNVGLANGFVMTFTNGLKVYLSGDTGLTSDMSTIVRGYYGADVAVINMGDIFTTGPEEAAFAVTDFIRATSVIPSHVNEAATQGGVPVVGSRTARFAQLASQGKTSVFLPLSGVTMEFNEKGRCEVGCRGK